jgi:hypothetical protein
MANEGQNELDKQFGQGMTKIIIQNFGRLREKWEGCIDRSID